MEDSLGVASRLKDKLHTAGVEVQVATLESVKYSRAADLDLNSLESFEKSLPAFKKPLAAIFNLSGLGFSKNVLETPASDRRRFLEELALAQFYLGKMAVKAFDSQDPRKCLIVSATAMGGDFGILKDTQYFAGQAATAGFLKSMAKEHPTLRVHLADFHPGEDLGFITQSLLGFTHEDGLSDPVEIGFINQKRYTQEPIKTPFPATGDTMNLDPEDLLLVSGGARGITADMVRELATQGMKRFLLAGRSAYTPESIANIPQEKRNEKDLKGFLFAEAKAKGEKVSPRDLDSQASRLMAQIEIQSQLHSLEALGAKAEYISLDVSNPEAVNQTLGSVQERLGPIAGYIHGAGILKDKLIRDKTEDQFLAVYRTKIDGLFNVLDALNGQDLKLVALFSSVAGKFGNVGQSDYASANEVLNHTALTHTGQWDGCRFLSVNWGPFAGGMVTKELARMFEAKGIGLIPPDAGASLFAREVLHGNPEVTEIVVGVGAIELGNSDDKPQELPLVHEFILDLNKDTWLLDHRLKDKAVVPMALVVEWAAQAASRLSPSLPHYEMQDLKILRGVSLDQTPVNFREEVRFIRPDTHGLHFEITWFSDAFGRGMEPAYNARLVLGEEAPMVSFLPEPDLNEETRPLNQLYRDYLFHGPSLQCITKVTHIGPMAMKATMMGSTPKNMGLGEPQSWSADPVLLDGMAQMGLIWLGTHQGCIGIPQGFERYVQLKPVAGKEITCLIQIDELREKAGAASMSMWFLGQDEEILAYGEGWKAIFNESFNSYTTKAKEEGAVNAS